MGESAPAPPDFRLFALFPLFLLTLTALPGRARAQKGPRGREASAGWLRGATALRALLVAAALARGGAQVEVTTLAGSGAAGTLDSTGTSATFFVPRGVAVQGGNVFVGDSGNHRVRKITSGGAVTTLAGSVAATFNNPVGVPADASGNVYAMDTFNNRIRKVTPLGVVTTFASSLVAPAGADIDSGGTL